MSTWFPLGGNKVWVAWQIGALCEESPMGSMGAVWGPETCAKTGVFSP